jgi:hypothetical protein
MTTSLPSNAVRLSLHPGQAAVHGHAARYKTIVAGRRWGKTLRTRTRLVSAALRSPRRFWYIAPTRIMAKDIMWADHKSTVA